MKRAFKRIAISGFYLSAVIVCYELDLAPVLSILSLPWSYPLLLFSGLILHTAANGEEQIALGKITGAIFNVLLYLYWGLGRNNKVSNGGFKETE